MTWGLPALDRVQGQAEPRLGGVRGIVQAGARDLTDNVHADVVRGGSWLAGVARGPRAEDDHGCRAQIREGLGDHRLGTEGQLEQLCQQPIGRVVATGPDQSIPALLAVCHESRPGQSADLAMHRRQASPRRPRQFGQRVLDAWAEEYLREDVGLRPAAEDRQQRRRCSSYD
ncbi:MAG: hypothetical protein LBG60_04615 [Bifidobacteriaceae bacterium]|jgi:hypothetical protein|nr:hypothetical protein [Bifidobacteriaceae bacterium]